MEHDLGFQIAVGRKDAAGATTPSADWSIRGVAEAGVQHSRGSKVAVVSDAWATVMEGLTEAATRAADGVASNASTPTTCGMRSPKSADQNLGFLVPSH